MATNLFDGVNHVVDGEAAAHRLRPNLSNCLGHLDEAAAQSWSIVRSVPRHGACYSLLGLGAFQERTWVFSSPSAAALQVHSGKMAE
jgi:hypothetical protein